jgi:hypothetical protein
MPSFESNDDMQSESRVIHSSFAFEHLKTHFLGYIFYARGLNWETKKWSMMFVVLFYQPGCFMAKAAMDDGRYKRRANPHVL